MDTTPDLKLVGTALVNGQPLACTSCANTFSLEVHRHLVLETAPAWISCLACGRGEDSPVITNGLVDAALAASTGRQRAEDRDTFTAEWRGTVMSGELYPQFVLDDAVQVAAVVKDQATRDAKAWGRAKKRQIRSVRDDAVKAATRKADQAAGTVRAAALTAAWTMRTGGAGPTRSLKPKRRRCSVKGCRKGTLTIRTRIHSTTGKTQTVKVPCAVCGRAGGGK
ncbi:hypothetical protein ACF09I_35615 [Streptomyces sp. NPDC014940]|uniref:hypothetical protein n=1 Tax=Streptomyces sp. NPDC014940 TaxID=3364932 RepID=UPI0036F77EB9